QMSTEHTVSNHRVFIGELFWRAGGEDHPALTLNDFQGPPDHLRAGRWNAHDTTRDDPAAVTEVEPEDKAVALAAVEHPLNFGKRHGRPWQIVDVSVVCDVVVVAADHRTMPGYVDEDRIVLPGIA